MGKPPESMDPPSSSPIVFSGDNSRTVVQIICNGEATSNSMDPPSSSPIVLMWLLIPPNRTNQIEVIPCVIQVHRPLLKVIRQLSVDIMRGVPLPQAKRLAVGVERCLQEMGQAQHLNVSPPGTISVHTCGSYITLNTVMAGEMWPRKYWALLVM